MGLKFCQKVNEKLLFVVVGFLMSLTFVSTKSDAGIAVNEKDESVNQFKLIDEGLVTAKKEIRRKSLEKFHEIFGISPEYLIDESRHLHREVPPKFMTDLYNILSEPSGVTRKNLPFNSKVVRSFLEKDNSSSKYFYFNISGLEVSEIVLEAQFRLFRMHTSEEDIPLSMFRYPHYLVRLYQVVDKSMLDTPDIHIPLSVDYVRAHDAGWHVFNVKQAVQSWLSGKHPNLGLLVTASTIFGETVHPKFARRGEHHGSRQPVLILFNDELGMRNDFSSLAFTEDTSYFPAYNSESESIQRHETPVNENYDRVKRHIDASSSNLQPNMYANDHSVPNIRNMDTSHAEDIKVSENTTAGNNTKCSKVGFYVDFTELGWDFIESPQGYFANLCEGSCDFPLSSEVNPSNHATVLSIVNKLRLGDVGKRCCVATKLASILTLYRIDSDIVSIKKFNDMVADTCGCR